MDKLSVIKIRIFGSVSCDECKKQTKAFDMHSIDYDFVDANADINEKLSDQHNVDELPHTQAYDLSTGKIIYQKIGYVSPSVFLSHMAVVLEETRHPKNLSIEGARPSPLPRVEPIIGKQVGCKGCKNGSKAS